MHPRLFHFPGFSLLINFSFHFSFLLSRHASSSPSFGLPLSCTLISALLLLFLSSSNAFLSFCWLLSDDEGAAPASCPPVGEGDEGTGTGVELGRAGGDGGKHPRKARSQPRGGSGALLSSSTTHPSSSLSTRELSQTKKMLRALQLELSQAQKDAEQARSHVSQEEDKLNKMQEDIKRTSGMVRRR